MTPCIECEAPVDSEIWETELGFCLPCSNDYWEHKGRWANV